MPAFGLMTAGIASVKATAGQIAGGEAAKQQLQAAKEAQARNSAAISDTYGRNVQAFGNARESYENFGNQALGAWGQGYGDANAAIGQGIGSINQAGLAGQNALMGGYGNAYGSVQQGLQGGMGSLYGGLNQATNTIGGVQNRLGALYDQGFNFQADPGYQFRLQAGQNAIDNKMSAAGGRLSSASLNASNAMAQGLASQEYQNAFNRFQQMGSMAGAADQFGANLALNQAQMQFGAGQNALNAQMQAGNTLGMFGMQTGQNLAQNQQWMGSNAANMYGQQANNAMQFGSGTANVFGNMGSQIGNTYQNQANSNNALLGMQIGNNNQTVNLAGGQMQAYSQGFYNNAALTSQADFSGLAPQGGGSTPAPASYSV